jgi:hypothetical protein
MGKRRYGWRWRRGRPHRGGMASRLGERSNGAYKARIPCASSSGSPPRAAMCRRRAECVDPLPEPSKGHVAQRWMRRHSAPHDSLSGASALPTSPPGQAEGSRKHHSCACVECGRGGSVEISICRRTCGCVTLPALWPDAGQGAALPPALRKVIEGGRQWKECFPTCRPASGLGPGCHDQGQ